MPKRIFSLMLSTVITLAAAGTSKAISLDNSILTDIDSHWSEADITTLYRAGILNGSDNKANPESMITRGEFTALISRALDLKSQNADTFEDVPPGHIFFNNISAASSSGIITGMTDGKFYPNKAITREEIMLIISRCLPDSKGSSSFSDISKKYKYLSELNKAVSSGIISGYSDNTFRPANNATRAESASMIVRLMKNTDGASESRAKSFSKKYIANDIENMEKNIPLSCGSALDELYYRMNSADEIEENGVKVEKTLEKLSLEDVNCEGLISKAEYTGDITYKTTYSDGSESKKSYLCEITADMISRDSGLYVYNYNFNLKMKKKINLTWEVYSSPPDYAPEGVNVVSPSSFQLSAENLGVESTNISSGINLYNSLTHAYMDYANKNGYDVWPMYKTDFSLKTSNSFLNDASARQKALNLLIKYACKYKIHGINFDFENVSVSNRALLTKHVREAALALHEMGLIVSADVTRKEPTSSVWSMCYDRDSLAETADYIMLMAYDEYYAGSPVAGSVSSLDWAEDTVKLTLTEVSPQKLVLGIPFYMRYWEVTNGKVTSSKAISMQTAYNMINSNNVSYTWIESDKQYKISWQDGTKTCMFWLENSDTVSLRVDIANRYSLAGIASWRRGLETQNMWSVISSKLN